MLYMPHCELKLYEMVIRANWTLEGVRNMVFLANRFGDYVDKWVYALGRDGLRLTRVYSNAGCKLERETPCMMRLGRWIGNPRALA